MYVKKKLNGVQVRFLNQNNYIVYNYMLSIITPCYRQYNIPKLYNSIIFDKINKWIIVYDTSNNKKYNKLYENHEKILEIECSIIGKVGNPQRNVGINYVDDGYIYFLDDDNIIHPNFWSIINILDSNVSNVFVTFDQLRKNRTLYGKNIKVNQIDTAMFIVHKKHINNIKWREDKYNADGFFITEIYDNNKKLHKYMNQIGCYYNFLENNKN